MPDELGDGGVLISGGVSGSSIGTTGSGSTGPALGGVPSGEGEGSQSVDPNYVAPASGDGSVQPAGGTTASSASSGSGSNNDALTAEQQRQQALDKAAALFDLDIAQTQMQNGITLDSLGRPAPISWVEASYALLYLTAIEAGSLGISVLRALENEVKFDWVDDEMYLKNFARYGWDDEESDKAREMMRIWALMPDEEKEWMPSYKWMRMIQTPEPTAEATPYVDPCQDAADMRACYVSTLQGYGVDVMNQEDITTHNELRGITLEEFSDEQLATVLQGVNATGEMLLPYVRNIPGMDEETLRNLTPEQAFALVFAHVEFGYVPSRSGSGATITIGDPQDLSNPIYIVLDNSSFELGPYLHPSFVAVHELGHAFHNRYGGEDGTGLEPIAGRQFVDATESEWDLGTGTYIALGFGRMPVPPKRYFPNDLRDGGSNPSEGFADTFSQFVLDPFNPDIFPSDSLRYQYFEENMPQWVIDMISRGGV